MDRRSLRDALFDLVPILAGLALLWRLVEVWSARLPFPYDLEWMEGGMLAHGWRVAEGLPLYVEPGPDFIPFLYPPLYPWVLGVLAQVVELGHPLGRAVSLVGTILGALAIVFGVGRQGRSWTVGVASALVFLGCYPHSGAFYDLVRTDGLLVGLLGWSIVLALERHRAALVISGLLLALAFLAKHNAALLGLPLVLGIAARDGWRPAALFGLSAALPAVLVTIGLQIASGGLFLTYLLGVPAAHPMVGHRIVPGLPRELADHLTVAVAVSAAFLVLRTLRGSGRARWGVVLVGLLVGGYVIASLPAVRGLRDPGPEISFVGGAALAASLLAVVLGAPLRWRDGRWVIGAGVGLVMVVATALMRGHHGGFLNVYVPIHWAIAFAFGIALARWRQLYRGRRPAVAVSALLTLQLTLHHVDLDGARLTPDPGDVEAGDAIVAALAEQEGPILAPFQPWMAAQAGFEPGFHLIALWDIDHEGGPLRPYVARIRKAAEEEYWGAVLDARRGIAYGIPRHYEVTVVVEPANARALVPKSGWRVRPRAILTPGGSQSVTLGEMEVDAIDPDRPVRIEADRTDPAPALADLLTRLGRRGVDEVEVRVGAQRATVPTAPVLADGTVDAGIVSLVADAAADRVLLRPMGAPVASAAPTLTSAGLEAVWEALGGQPPRFAVAWVPGDCNVGCALDRLRKTRRIPGMEQASLGVDWPKRPEEEPTPDVSIEGVADLIRRWPARRIDLPTPPP